MSRVITNTRQDIKLEIAEDNLAAWLTIDKREGFVDENEILNLLRQSNITHGFVEASTSLLREGFVKQPGKPFPIALCRVGSKQPEIIPMFDRNHTFKFGVSLIRRNTQTWGYVKKGSVVARLLYEQEVGRVFNIFGEPVEAEFNLDQYLKEHIGSQISYDPKTQEFITETNGYPYFDSDNRLCLASEFTIERNLDTFYGDIALAGNLTIHGSIYEGCSVSVLGNLHITGNVEHSDIRCTGNLTIDGKVMSCNDVPVICDGDLTINAAERTKIICGGTIHLQDAFIDCQVTGEQGIYGESNESRIMGGSARSANSIELGSIGDAMGTDTEIEITISPYLKERMILTMREVFQCKEKSEPDKERIEQLNNDILRMEQKLQSEINRVLEDNNQANLVIRIHQTAYKGSYLRILKKSFTVLEDTKGLCFNLSNED